MQTGPRYQPKEVWLTGCICKQRGGFGTFTFWSFSALSTGSKSTRWFSSGKCMQMWSFKPTTDRKKYCTNVVARKWVIINEQWANKDGRIGQLILVAMYHAVILTSCCYGQGMPHLIPNRTSGESLFHGHLKPRMQLLKGAMGNPMFDSGRWTLNAQQRLVQVNCHKKKSGLECGRNTMNDTQMAQVLTLQRHWTLQTLHLLHIWAWCSNDSEAATQR